MSASPTRRTAKTAPRAYTASLSEEEKGRMIGDIQFDMLGGLGSDDTLVCTMDGEANWVSDLLQEKDPSLERGRRRPATTPPSSWPGSHPSC